MTPIAPHITAFFQQRLPVERGASSHTSDSYAYAFKLLLEYASQRLHVRPSALRLEQIDSHLVVDFLNHLETVRANRPSSRNVRLAAIKSFMHFLEFREPAAIDQIRRILAIPPKKTETRLVRHLTVEEIHAILNAPDPSAWDGIRDRAMLHLCFAAGLRVSELVGLQLRDVTLQPHASILVHGKGRRERCLPLWKVTTAALRAWLGLRGTVPTPEVFVRRSSDALGVRVHPGQARRDSSEILSRAGDEARLAPRPATHVCPHRLAGHQGHAQGLSLARTCPHADNRDVHARGSVGETRGTRIDDCSKAAIRSLQGHGQVDRLSDITLRNAEDHALKGDDLRGSTVSGSA